MKILIFGKNGQLGYELNEFFIKSNSHEVKTLGSSDVDFTDTESIKNSIAAFEPNIIFNASAYTAVDKAEQESELAQQINAEALKSIAKASNALSTKPWVVHFSTDYVFNGKSVEPYREEDNVAPLGVYGSTKLEGEENLLNHYDNVLVFRISWVYSYRAANFVKTMIRLANDEARSELNVVNDQFGCPNYAPDLAVAMGNVVESIQNGRCQRGVYHLSSSEVTNWYEFACAIIAQSNCNCKVNPIPSTEFPTPAERPKYSVMNSDKVKDVFSIELPSWKDSLDRCLRNIC